LLLLRHRRRALSPLMQVCRLPAFPSVIGVIDLFKKESQSQSTTIGFS
jgi:hypothetical protein